MFDVKKSLCAIVRVIPDLERVTSSWRSARTMAPLPAIVIDLRSVKPGETTEAGEVLTYIHTFDMALHVSLQGLTDDEAEDALEELMDTFTTALETQYGKQYKIEDWWPHDVPWGTNEALAGAFSLVIEQ